MPPACARGTSGAAATQSLACADGRRRTTWRMRAREGAAHGEGSGLSEGSAPRGAAQVALGRRAAERLWCERHGRGPCRHAARRPGPQRGAHAAAAAVASRRAAAAAAVAGRRLGVLLGAAQLDLSAPHGSAPKSAGRLGLSSHPRRACLLGVHASRWRCQGRLWPRHAWKRCRCWGRAQSLRSRTLTASPDAMRGRARRGASRARDEANSSAHSALTPSPNPMRGPAAAPCARARRTRASTWSRARSRRRATR